MGIFKWIFLGPNPLEIISLGYNYFQKLFFEKIFTPNSSILEAFKIEDFEKNFNISANK